MFCILCISIGTSVRIKFVCLIPWRGKKIWNISNPAFFKKSPSIIGVYSLSLLQEETLINFISTG